MQDKGYRIDRDRIVYFFLTFITAALYIYTCICTAIKITISVTRHGYSVLTLSLFTLGCAFCTLWSDTLRYTWSNTAISSHNDGLNSPLIIHHRQLICFFLLLLIHFRRLLRMTNYFFRDCFQNRSARSWTLLRFEGIFIVKWSIQFSTCFLRQKIIRCAHEW